MAKVQLADIEKLERENSELKQKVGAYERQVLLELRAITLRRENDCLREIVTAIPK